jgi:hypothetical protein
MVKTDFMCKAIGLPVIRTFGAKKSGNRLKLCNLQSFPVRLTETGKATDDNYLQAPCTKFEGDPRIA